MRLLERFNYLFDSDLEDVFLAITYVDVRFKNFSFITDANLRNEKVSAAKSFIISFFNKNISPNSVNKNLNVSPNIIESTLNDGNISSEYFDIETRYYFLNLINVNICVWQK